MPAKWMNRTVSVKGDIGVWGLSLHGLGIEKHHREARVCVDEMSVNVSQVDIQSRLCHFKMTTPSDEHDEDQDDNSLIYSEKCSHLADWVFTYP
jgi:hypothetical protein